MSRLDELQTFVDVVEAGSLTAAARRRGLALSAVSRRIKDLETRLGITLLRRTTRRMNLTDDGRDFFHRSRQILSDLDEAEAALRDSRAALRGRIRLAAPQSFTVRHLAEPLAAFAARHPDLRLEIDLSDRRIDLLEEGVDLALRIGRLEDSSLVARRLTRVRHLPCAAPSLLDRIGRPARPEDLADAPLLAYRTRGDRVRWTFARPDGTRGEVSAPARLWCNNGDLLMRQAEAGLGIAVEPTFITSDALLAGRLEPLFPDHLWSDNAAYAVYPTGRALPRRVRALIDHLAEALSPDPPWDRALRTRFGLFADDPAPDGVGAASGV